MIKIPEKYGRRKNTQRGKTIGVAASFAIIVAIGAFYYAVNIVQLSAQPENGHKEASVMAGQYVDYPNLKDLTNSADAVVVGKIAEVKGTHGHPAAQHMSEKITW